MNAQSYTSLVSVSTKSYNYVNILKSVYRKLGENLVDSYRRFSNAFRSRKALEGKTKQTIHYEVMGS